MASRRAASLMETRTSSAMAFSLPQRAERRVGSPAAKTCQSGLGGGGGPAGGRLGPRVVDQRPGHAIETWHRQGTGHGAGPIAGEAAGRVVREAETLEQRDGREGGDQEDGDAGRHPRLTSGAMRG